MKNQDKACILEAMEQQTISLAKVPIIIFENIESKLASREEC
jgi:DNA replicative helicase MCM subunit Mcm2 (Cdc46/Mcm family)